MKQELEIIRRQERRNAKHEIAAATLGERVMGTVQWQKKMTFLRRIHVEIAHKLREIQAKQELVSQP